MSSERNPYAPPSARVADSSVPIAKARTIVWATAALWAAYALTLLHGIIVIGDRWLEWPPERVVLNQIGFELFYAGLIYFVGSGRYAARLIYAVLLGLRTITVVRMGPADWQASHGLVLVTATSFLCQYAAMYWLLAQPGRRWFIGDRA